MAAKLAALLGWPAEAADTPTAEVVADDGVPAPAALAPAGALAEPALTLAAVAEPLAGAALDGLAAAAAPALVV